MSKKLILVFFSFPRNDPLVSYVAIKVIELFKTLQSGKKDLSMLHFTFCHQKFVSLDWYVSHYKWFTKSCRVLSSGP